MAKVFLSHSHDDHAMAKRLHDGLDDADKDVWADWEDIPPASVFQRDLDEGVAGCDAFVFLISPDSVSSKYCLDELERATELNKKIVPVVHRPVDADEMPLALSERNWIPQQGSVADDFESYLARVIEAIDTDLDWTREHTRWGSRALDWDGNGRDKSLLLRGEELERAEGWLARAEGRTPTPTDLQRDFVRASRAEATRSRRARIGFAAGALGLVLVLGVVTLLIVANQNEKDDKIAYIRSVGAILNESNKGLSVVQAVFSELDARSKGRTKKLTPVPKLRIQLREAYNQRTTLRRRSRALAEPSDLARRMRATLVGVFTLKLANIRDIQHCVPFAEGRKPRRAALARCLADTKGTSEPASKARDRFLRVYNDLRQDAGLEPTSPRF